jgi:transcriptional regulator with XRE-family HTH domain
MSDNPGADLPQKLGVKLKEVRLKAGLSQRALGHKMGLRSQGCSSQIFRLEAGRHREPGLVTVIRYLHACNEPVGRFFLGLAQDGVFGTAEEPIVLAPKPESPEARWEAARARAREMRGLRKHARRELLGNLEEEIAPIVRPYLVGAHATRMGAYVSAAEQMYKTGKKLLAKAGGAPLAMVLKPEFDRIEGMNESWFLNPEALHQVRLLVERKLRQL